MQNHFNGYYLHILQPIKNIWKLVIARKDGMWKAVSAQLTAVN